MERVRHPEDREDARLGALPRDRRGRDAGAGRDSRMPEADLVRLNVWASDDGWGRCRDRAPRATWFTSITREAFPRSGAAEPSPDL